MNEYENMREEKLLLAIGLISGPCRGHSVRYVLGAKTNEWWPPTPAEYICKGGGESVLQIWRIGALHCRHSVCECIRQQEDVCGPHR